MTAAQMMCHLNDSFLAAMGEKYVSPATGPIRRTLMKWGALYVPLRWPKNVSTRPEMRQGCGGTPPGRFEDDRARLVRTVKQFSSDPKALNGKPHPLFGPMTGAQWQRWGFLHSDHHLRQFGH
jgi:hypothetical protein